MPFDHERRIMQRFNAAKHGEQSAVPDQARASRQVKYIKNEPLTSEVNYETHVMMVGGSDDLFISQTDVNGHLKFKSEVRGFVVNKVRNTAKSYHAEKSRLKIREPTNILSEAMGFMCNHNMRLVHTAQQSSTMQSCSINSYYRCVLYIMYRCTN